MADGALSHDLEDELKKRGIQEVVIVGAHGEHCVAHTARDTHKLGYKTFLVEDAIIPGDEEGKAWGAVRKELEASGIKIVKIHDSAIGEIKHAK